MSIKAVICGACAAVMIVLCGCNQTVIDFNYYFNKAICFSDFDGDGEPEWKTLSVKEWCDYEGDTIQIVDTEGNVYLFHSNNCTLVGE